MRYATVSTIDFDFMSAIGRRGTTWYRNPIKQRVIEFVILIHRKEYSIEQQLGLFR